MNDHREPIAAIEKFGYSQSEAAFLYIVATHSGYFTRSQFLRYTGLKKGCLVHRLTTRALNLKHVTIKQYGQTHVYHLFSRQIYRAIEKDNLRNRRDLSKELVRTRLLILDFVLAQPDCQYLETETDKVRYFHNGLDIPISMFPSRTYKSLKSNSQTIRYFVDRFPIFLDTDLPTFVYCDSDLPGLFSFATYLRNYEPLLHHLQMFKLIYASPTPAKCGHAQRLFTRLFAINRHTDVGGIARYFQVRRLWEGRQTESLTRADRDCLREGDQRFQGQRFEELYRQWAAGKVPQTDLERQFGAAHTDHTPRIETCLLPENYDVFRQVTSAPIRPSSEIQRSSFRSNSELANPEAKFMKRQGL